MVVVELLNDAAHENQTYKEITVSKNDADLHGLTVSKSDANVHGLAEEYETLDRTCAEEAEEHIRKYTAKENLPKLFEKIEDDVAERLAESNNVDWKILFPYLAIYTFFSLVTVGIYNYAPYYMQSVGFAMCTAAFFFTAIHSVEPPKRETPDADKLAELACAAAIVEYS